MRRMRRRLARRAQRRSARGLCPHVRCASASDRLTAAIYQGCSHTHLLTGSPPNPSEYARWWRRHGGLHDDDRYGPRFRRPRHLPSPPRGSVSGDPLALVDLRQVDAGDPALHHPVRAGHRFRRCSRSSRFFAILFTKQYPESLFKFDVGMRRWEANVSAYVGADARRVPAVLVRRRTVRGGVRRRVPDET